MIIKHIASLWKFLPGLNCQKLGHGIDDKLIWQSYPCCHLSVGMRGPPIQLDPGGGYYNRGKLFNPIMVTHTLLKHQLRQLRC